MLGNSPQRRGERKEKRGSFHHRGAEDSKVGNELRFDVRIGKQRTANSERRTLVGE
jgi:hypothetical protein